MYRLCVRDHFMIAHSFNGGVLALPNAPTVPPMSWTWYFSALNLTRMV